MQRNRTPTGLFTGSFFTFAKSQRKIRVKTVGDSSGRRSTSLKRGVNEKQQSLTTL
jgi:hypothetical protein